MMMHDEQVMALAMARHARLGAASPAAVLPADALQIVMRFVQAAHQQLISTPRLIRVYVRTGDLVDRVEFHFSDGTVRSHGGRGGHLREPFVLNTGEYITGIAGRAGDSLDSISFRTSEGRQHTFAGRLNGGVHFTMSCETGEELADAQFARRSRWLQSVLHIETRRTPWLSNMAKLLIKHPSKPFETSAQNNFVHRVGALTAGGDVAEPRMCTLAEATAFAATMNSCVGFTFNYHRPTFEGRLECWFKTWNVSANTDWEWQSYRRFPLHFP